MAWKRVLVALALGCSLVTAAPAQAGSVENGRVWRGDGVLKQGCRDYPFRYRVRPGAGTDWGVEFFLVGPKGEGLGTVNRLSGNAPKRGRAKFEVCRASTRPGTFRIRGKLTVVDDYETDVRWLQPARFQLRRP